MKQFIENNKKKMITILGICLIVAGVIGMAMTFFGSRKADKLNLLCIGVDKYVPMDQRVEGSNSIGQADGIFLLSIDKRTKSMDIVSIPRDTMVMIEKYYSNMEYIGQEEAQICLQYAYADGMERSCELMVDRVEEIFEGIEINGYVSMNMSAVLELNDAVGGVWVTVEDEIAARALGVEPGTEVRLTSEALPYYIHPRDKKEPQSAYGRTLRYKDYVKAFISQSATAVKNDPGLIKDALSILDEHLVTDLEISDIVDLSIDLSGMSMKNVEYHTLEGNIILGTDGYEEFYPNKKKLDALRERIY